MCSKDEVECITFSMLTGGSTECHKSEHNSVLSIITGVLNEIKGKWKEVGDMIKLTKWDEKAIDECLCELFKTVHRGQILTYFNFANELGMTENLSKEQQNNLCTILCKCFKKYAGFYVKKFDNLLTALCDESWK